MLHIFFLQLIFKNNNKKNAVCCMDGKTKCSGRLQHTYKNRPVQLFCAKTSVYLTHHGSCLPLHTTYAGGRYTHPFHKRQNLALRTLPSFYKPNSLYKRQKNCLGKTDIHKHITSSCCALLESIKTE